jgi:hypothetical protein
VQFPKQLPTQDEILAFGRHVVSAVTPVLMMFGAFAVLTPDQQHQVIAAINQIFVGVGEIFKGAADAWAGFLMLGFLVPLVMGWFARNSAKPENQVKSAAEAVDSGKLKGVAILPTEDVSPVSGASGDLGKAAVLLAAATQKP